jgi:putative spermidine/putrescine transport system substrate-binding protein
MRKTSIRAIAASAAIAFALAGCGGSSSETTTETTIAAAEETPAEETPAETSAPAAEEAPAETSAPAEEAAVETTVAAAAGGNEAAAGIAAPDLPMATEIGAGEGSVNIVAWPGYTEKAWVEPFQVASGCKVNVKVGNTSDEMVSLMQTGEYDVVSASGDASLRLVAAGEVSPVNVDLLKNYADVYPGLKGKPWNSVAGKAYGVPHGRGANLLMYNTEKFPTAPDSWSVVWEADSPAKGSVTAYDAPIYIADAAVYLMSTKPELKITNPYALDETQFAAALELLKQQKPLVSEYWSDYLKQMAAFKTGTMTAGTTWQVVANASKGEGTKVEVVLPKEGSTGWSDTWMVSSKSKNPNCAYMWMDYIISPEGNAMATEYFGEAPSNQKSCALTTNKDHCTTFHAGDEDYFSKIWYWTTPTKECLDGRGPICMEFAEWTKAWTELKG